MPLLRYIEKNSCIMILFSFLSWQWFILFLVKQDLPTLPQHPSLSTPSLSGCLVEFMQCFVDYCLSFCPPFSFAIVVSVLLRFMASARPFKLFLFSSIVSIQLRRRNNEEPSILRQSLMFSSITKTKEEILFYRHLEVWQQYITTCTIINCTNTRLL